MLNRGHPAKNDCSTKVLLDFCTRATFLRSVPQKFSTVRCADVFSKPELSNESFGKIIQ
jgi:hypothetical protein